MKTLSQGTKIHELLTTHPFLEDFPAAKSPKLEMLKNKMARATIGRVATLKTAAGIAGLDPGDLVASPADEIARVTGARPQTELGEDAGALDRSARVETLKEIISHLHNGGDLNDAKKRFAEAMGDVEASEIAQMEEELI